MAVRWMAMPWVQAELTRITKKREERLDIKADEAMIECRRIALSDIIGMFNDNGSIRKIAEIPESIRRVMSGFEVSEIWGEDDEGNKSIIGELKKVKLWSKDKAIDMLFKHHGLYLEDNKQKEMSVTDIMAVIMGQNGS
jgi:phage terminase small subunit